MAKYRLKKEATPYFKETLATSIYDYETWEKLNVDDKALEEVEPAYLTFGHLNKDKASGTLSGWDGDTGSHFHFTIFFPSLKYHGHDVFTKGRVTRELMSRIQNVVNSFCENFNPID